MADIKYVVNVERSIKANERIIKRLDPSLLEVKSIDEEHRIIWHPITREVPDRMGDIVRVDGVDVEDFKRKPAVLYGHDYRSMNPVPVIGTNIGFEKQGDTLYAGTQFLDTSNVSAPLRDLVNDNFILQSKKLLGWSIGFMPVDWAEIKENGIFKGYDFVKSSLLEYSSVVIPAHQDAVNNWLKQHSRDAAVVKFFDMHVDADALLAEQGAVVRIGKREPHADPNVGIAVVKSDDERFDVAKPYPNEHACRLRDPADFESDSFKRTTREHEGKEYSIIMGHLKGETTMTEQAYRYAKATWEASAARAHCASHDGSFEAASSESDLKPCAECAIQDAALAEDKTAATAAASAETIQTSEHRSPSSSNSQQQGGTMLKTILEKLAKGETLKQEELDFLQTLESAQSEQRAARILERGDGAPVTRNINEILSVPARLLNDVEREVQTFCDDAYIAATILNKNPRSLKMWEKTLSRSGALRKAMAEATANAGAEWVPTLLSADFIEKFRLEAKVASLFTDLPMPSNPWKIPYMGGLSASDFYYVGESTSDSPTASPPTTLATADQTLTAKKLKCRVPFSDELNEDSIVAVIPTLRAELVRGGAEAVEDAIINGDTTATHQDSDVVDSKDRRKAWKGLRVYTQSGAKSDLATFNTANVLALLVKMDKWGINPADLAFIAGPTSFNKFRGLTEVLTVDKYGPNAVILNGELARLFGSPILVSEYIRQNLNATGVYDGSTTTKTIFVIVNRRCFTLGTRGTPKLTFKNDAEVDQNQLIMSFRKAFQPRYTPGASVLTTAVAYNIA